MRRRPRRREAMPSSPRALLSSVRTSKRPVATLLRRAHQHVSDEFLGQRSSAANETTSPTIPNNDTATSRFA